MLGDDAMGEFMEEERGEEEKAREHTDGPLLSGEPAGLMRELLFEKVGVGGKNDDPRGMKIDRYPKDSADPHSGAWGHVDGWLEAKRCAAENRRGSFASFFLSGFAPAHSRVIF